MWQRGDEDVLDVAETVGEKSGPNSLRLALPLYEYEMNCNVIDKTNLKVVVYNQRSRAMVTI